MFDLLKLIPGLMKWKRVGIDNYVFRLHCEATTIALISLSFLLSSKQYFGDPIACISKSGVPENALNNYCWLFSTFSVKKHMEGEMGKDIAHPGVGPYDDKDGEVVYHKYYQWVGLILFCQAWSFYSPYYLWKKMEGGVVEMLIGEELGYCLVNNKWCDEHKNKIAEYLTGRNLHRRAIYALNFILTMILNIVNVVAQICFLNKFLGNEFAMYGPLSVESYYSKQGDPMTRLFPKVTKCTFYDYGPTGSVQTIDALCVLPLNIFNERIFVALWFWLITLAFVSIVDLLYRLMRLAKCVRMYDLISLAQFVDYNKIKLIIEECHYGDWFLLTLVGQNLNPIMFHEVLEAVASNLKRTKSTSANAPLLAHDELGNTERRGVEQSDQMSRQVVSAVKVVDKAQGSGGDAIAQFAMDMEDMGDVFDERTGFQKPRDGVTRRRIGDGADEDNKGQGTQEHFV